VHPALKVVITAVLIVAIVELSKRNTVAGGILASLPLLSVLAFVWLWIDTRDGLAIAELSTSIFWLVIPSLTLFVVLPLMLRRGFGFPLSLTVACAATAVAYTGMLRALARFGLEL